METFDELYYRQPGLREFDARVIACAPAEGGFDVTLDQTAFYPLGGGQPGDRGTLVFEDGDEQVSARVSDTTGGDGQPIVHHADRPVPVGSLVHGKLDWTWRRDNMEAHTGEHIVSGIVHGLYGYDNVGFHMGSRFIEVDFDGALDADQALDVERRANAAVRADLPVSALLPSPDELADLDYRSKRALEGPVRLVSIPDVDRCACCGLHVASTGEVGLIKIVNITTKRKRTRLELLCGRRALLLVEEDLAQLRETSNFLSVGDEETLDAVRRLAAERDDLKHQLRQAHHHAIDAELATLPAEGGLIVRHGQGLDVEERRYLCEQAVSGGLAEICAALSPVEGDPTRTNYVIASNTLDLRPACRELNRRLAGRGGGKPRMVQGSVAATPADTEAALRDIFST